MINEIVKKIDEETKERESKVFLAAYTMEIEKAKSHNNGEIKGLELAKQIILAEMGDVKSALERMKWSKNGLDSRSCDIIIDIINNGMTAEIFNFKQGGIHND